MKGLLVSGKTTYLRVLHPILMMEAENKPLTSIDNLMDAEFSQTGTRQREAFRKEAYDYCVKSNLEKEAKDSDKQDSATKQNRTYNE